MCTPLKPNRLERSSDPDMATKTCNNVHNMRMEKDSMTTEKAHARGFFLNTYLNFGTWQKVSITNNARMTTFDDLKNAGVLYTDTYDHVCRVWLSSDVSPQTFSIVNKVMSASDFVKVTNDDDNDLLTALPLEKVAELNSMGCYGRGWMKNVSEGQANA